LIPNVLMGVWNTNYYNKTCNIHKKIFYNKRK
jgi:hypothetical protein